MRKYSFPVRRFGLFGLFLLSAAPLGCGSKTGTVTGKVTLDGKPLLIGKISFTGKGKTVSADIIEGEYTAKKVPVGDVKVTVDTSIAKHEADNLLAGAQRGGGGMPPGGPPRGMKEGRQMPPEAKKALEEQAQLAAENSKKAKELLAKYRPIPEKYTKPESSGLSLTVTGGENSFDVPLKSR